MGRAIAGGRLGGLGLTTLFVVACYTMPALDVGPRPFGVTVDAHLTYYDVSAATLAEIRRGISQEGPRSQGRRWGAVTRWRLTWTYQRAAVGPISCELRKVRVRVQTTVTFPRWNPTAEPDSLLLVWWQQYNAGLAEHERGHAVLAVQGAGEFVTAAERIRAPCANLATQASMAFQRHVQAINAKQEEYDRTTLHGATQIRAVRLLQEP